MAERMEVLLPDIGDFDDVDVAEVLVSAGEDEHVRVWDVARTANEIMSFRDRFDFEGAGDTNAVNPVAWYPFDDGEAAINGEGAEDYSNPLDWNYSIAGVTFSSNIFKRLNRSLLPRWIGVAVNRSIASALRLSRTPNRFELLLRFRM